MIHAQNGIDTVLLAPVAAGAVATSAARTASWDLVMVDGRASYAEIRLTLGAESNTDATGSTISLLESDDTVVTNHATFNASFERTSEDSAAAKEIRYLIDCKSRKRYLRLVLTPQATTDGPLHSSAIGTLTRAGVQPGSTTDMGDDVVVIG